MANASRAKRPLHLSDLEFDPQNANRGTDRGRQAIGRSITEYGTGRPVVIDRRGRIIAGNKTVELAKRLNLPLRVVNSDGRSLIAICRTDLDLRTDPRAKGLAIADNRTNELNLEWDPAVLQQLIADGMDLSTWWTDRELEDLLETATADLEKENTIIEPQPSDIRRGEIFYLDRHRVMCGDATSAADVGVLLGKDLPDLMATDPPYGVKYDPAWRHRAYPGQRTVTGKVLNDDRASWKSAWDLFPGAVAYVWHAGLKASEVAADLERSGFKLRSQIIWLKQHFALSRGDYHWAHEPAWYAVRSSSTRRWYGGRTQTTIWEVPNLNPIGGTRDAENTTTGHATQKPVKLFELPILNHTVKGDTVYDPFCGSGTAVIAAEKTGRSCLALELDPRYVQVIVKRWEAFTGRRAERHRVTSRAARRSQ